MLTTIDKHTHKEKTKERSYLSFRVTNLHSVFPALPEITPGQEASHRVPGQVVYPALFPELRHDCVNPRKSGFPV